MLCRSTASRSHGSSCRKRSATSYVAPPQHSTDSSSGSVRPTYGATRSRSLVRTRVASRDWCASRKVVSVTSTPVRERRSAAKPSGPSSSSRCREPCGEGLPRSTPAGSFSRGSSRVGALPYGLLTVTSASQRSIRVPRSAGTWVVSSSGRCSMNAVDTSPAMKSGSASTACRNGMLVLTPRIRNSARARRERATAAAKFRPRQVSLTSMESKCGLISTPCPPCRRPTGPPRRPRTGRR